MNNEYYGAPSTPTEDFLAHYGVKGMKWGVRKAIERGSDRALRRQYKKASKKLAKLEKLGASGKKYAKRAVAYGAGAAAAGGLAAAGTAGVGRLIGKTGGVIRKAGPGVGNAMVKVGEAARKSNIKFVRDAGRATAHAGRTFRNSGAANVATALGKAGGSVGVWGNQTTLSDAARKGLGKANTAVTGATNRALGVGNQVSATIGRGTSNAKRALNGVSNNTLARIGAGAIGAGLGVAAARNTYRAATAKKHAAQAQEFRREMNKAFAGTKYANGMPSKKKRRK